MIKLELTEQDAVLFKKFREVQDTFTVLEESGVFNIQNGQAILSFDYTGTLCDVDMHLKRYKRGKAIIPILVVKQ